MAGPIVVDYQNTPKVSVTKKVLQFSCGLRYPLIDRHLAWPRGHPNFRRSGKVGSRPSILSLDGKNAK